MELIGHSLAAILANDPDGATLSLAREIVMTDAVLTGRSAGIPSPTRDKAPEAALCKASKVSIATNAAYKEALKALKMRLSPAAVLAAAIDRTVSELLASPIQAETRLHLIESC